MKSLYNFIHESEFTHNEKFWDKKFKVALKRMPDWYDEKIDITNSIRQSYNELELDVIEGEKGYVEMINNKKYGNQPDVYIKFASDIWKKLKGNEWAKQNALEDYLHWLE